MQRGQWESGARELLRALPFVTEKARNWRPLKSSEIHLEKYGGLSSPAPVRGTKTKEKNDG